ncbi:MAG TPA: class I SAM-dependent methyltransferase [Gammaproteobacteria bacterium]|nr:class I SAM-dependent methyltransferase [Gammaproteobacteria bacterium]
MTHRTLLVAQDVYDYALGVSPPEHPALAGLRRATASVDKSEMQISPDQGRFMALLVKLIGARRCIEIGTYTGYSALAVALALPPDGQLVACDVNAEWTDVGRKYWRDAGVESRIDLRIRPALDTLDEVLAAGAAGTFDFAFVDADKPNYGAYLEKLLVLLRAGGLIAVDNTLAVSGAPIVRQQTATAKALRAFNEAACRDQRVDFALLTIGEGLTLLRKRG